MIRFLARLVSGLLALAAVAAASAFGVLLFGMRTKHPVVLGAVRRFNRDVGNPQQLKNAGQPGAFAGIIRHVGRSSGRAYETPIGATATDEGFVIALPYGPDVDWLKNVVAAGTATLVHEGATYTVDQPQVVATTSVTEHLDAKEQRVLRVFGVQECVVLHRVDQAA